MLLQVLNCCCSILLLLVLLLLLFVLLFSFGFVLAGVSCLPAASLSASDMCVVVLFCSAPSESRHIAHTNAHFLRRTYLAE